MTRLRTLIRRLVNTAFTTRRVADLESRVRAIANDLIDGFVSRGQAETVARLLESQQYWTELIEKRAVRPRNDLVTALVAAAREEETPISLYQVINACSVIALAGHETTINLLGNCLYRLLSMPEQWELVCSDHANIPKAIEETLRRYLCARAHAHDH
jgi:cytochrome P450